MIADLPPGRTTAVLEPLPLPPARHSQRLAVPADALPPALLVVDVGELVNAPALVRGSEAGGGGEELLCPPELYVSIAVAAAGCEPRGPSGCPGEPGLRIERLLPGHCLREKKGSPLDRNVERVTSPKATRVYNASAS